MGGTIGEGLLGGRSREWGRAKGDEEGEREAKRGEEGGEEEDRKGDMGLY